MSGGLAPAALVPRFPPLRTAPVPAAPLLALLLIAPVADGAGRRAPLTAPKPPTAADAAVLWHTDFPAAQADAAARGVPLVVLLTGEDWCGPCIDLRDGVFARPAFARAAGDFAFVRFDSPRSDDHGPGRDEDRARYEAAAERYGTTAVPTVLVCDAAGVPVGVTGNLGGDLLFPGRYRAHLRELGDRVAVRDAAFAAADRLDGPAKAAALHAGLAAVWAEPGAGAERRARLLWPVYADRVAAALAADPADETGLAALWRSRGAAVAASERKEALADRVEDAYDRDGVDAALALRDDLLARDDLPPETRDLLLGVGRFLLERAERWDAALAETDGRLAALDSALPPLSDRDRRRLEFRRAVLFTRMQRWDEAAAAFESQIAAAEAAGDQPRAWGRAAAWHQLLIRERNADALALLTTGPLSGPRTAEQRETRAWSLAWTHAEGGRPREAGEAYEAWARAAEPAGRVHLFRRAAEQFAEAGDPAAARAALDRADAVPGPPVGDPAAAETFAEGRRLAAELRATLAE